MFSQGSYFQRKKEKHDHISFYFLDCFRRDQRNFKLYYVIVRDSLYAQSVEECSTLCGREDFCRTFAFR